MIGFPDGLELGEIFIWLLYQARKGINLLELLFIIAIKAGGDEGRNVSVRNVSVRNLVIHQAMKVSDDLNSEFVQDALAIEVIGMRVFAARTYGKPDVCGEVEGIGWHVERVEGAIFKRLIDVDGHPASRGRRPVLGDPMISNQVRGNVGSKSSTDTGRNILGFQDRGHEESNKTAGKNEFMLFSSVENEATRITAVQLGEHSSGGGEVVIFCLTIPGHFAHITVDGCDVGAFSPSIQCDLVDQLQPYKSAYLPDVNREIVRLCCKK